jgi:glutaredoxin 3
MEYRDMSEKTVVIYSTPTCPYCKLAKGFLSQKGIPYIEKDVASDPALADEMFEKSGQLGVPVILVDGEVIVGFDKGYLESVLG